MKTIAFLLAVMVMAVCSDIIPPGSHYCNKCVKITNADSLGDMVLIGYEKYGYGGKQVIVQDSCLKYCYKDALYYIFWSFRDTVTSRTLAGFNYDGVLNKTALNEPLFLVSDKVNPNGGYVPDADPLVGEELYYRLCEGFQLALWKKVSKFNDGTPDLTETFPVSSEKGKKSTQEKVSLSFTESSLLYSLPSPEPVTLEFFDPSGRLAARLSQAPAMENRAALPKLAAGTYIVKLKSAHYSASSAVTIKR